MPRWEVNEDRDADYVGSEAVYQRTTPTTKLDPNVLRDAGIDPDNDYYPAN